MAIRGKPLYLASLLVVIAAGAGTATWRLTAGKALRAAPELATGTSFAPSRELPDFSLIDTQGRPFGNANLRGHWSIMFFGYTNCPDFCPTTLTLLASLEKRLRAEHAAVLPSVIFVSVDAKRDTPQQMARYVPYFDPGFIGLTARDQPEIEAVARKLGVGVIITPRPDGTYTVDHSGAVFVLDPRGRMAAILTGPFTTDALQADFQRIVACGSC
ncbi:MAG TPA: SCO family protein [Steroidobacteraceae bacterium]|jgi:protein SCO1/2|nr:SCO family protein [Steroidobacteraceae bacterium]